MRQQGISGWRGLYAGGCRAWSLPADATCAAVARQVFRDSVSEVGLEPGLLDDCILMASELAANTLHARVVAGAGGGGICSWEESRSRPPALPLPTPPRSGAAVPNSGFTCAAWVSAASSSARSSTPAVAGGQAPRRRYPRRRSRP